MSVAWSQGAAAMLLSASLIAPGTHAPVRTDAALEACLHRAVQAAKTLVLVRQARSMPWPATRIHPEV